MRNNSRGFTLIELMITVAIVAILAAIAYPSYQNQIRRSNRSVAKTALMTYAQFLEKCYTQNSAYNVGCSYAPTDTAAFDGGRRLFSISPAGIAAGTFIITATAQNAQANDTDCAVFSLSNANVRTATNGSGTNCWQ